MATTSPDSNFTQPSFWSSSSFTKICSIAAIISIQPFSAKIFYQDRIRARLEAVREHYINKPELPFNSYFMQMELENLNLHVKWDERLFSSFYGFRIIIIYGFMLYLVIFNPFNF